MSKRNYMENLREVVLQLQQAEKHLHVSYQRCRKIGLEGPYNEDHLIEFEALTGRFARLVDMLVHKFFRSVDTVELVDTGTLIDVINRAEKRGLIDSALDVRMLKDLRNDIAHEYPAEKLIKLHREVYLSVPKLLNMVTSAVKYSQKYITPS